MKYLSGMHVALKDRMRSWNLAVTTVLLPGASQSNRQGKSTVRQLLKPKDERKSCVKTHLPSGRYRLGISSLMAMVFVFFQHTGQVTGAPVPLMYAYIEVNTLVTTVHSQSARQDNMGKFHEFCCLRSPAVWGMWALTELHLHNTGFWMTWRAVSDDSLAAGACTMIHSLTAHAPALIYLALIIHSAFPGLQAGSQLFIKL